jgi:hypothetical protein
VYQRRTRQAPSELPEEHPILSGAKPLFEAGRLSWNGNYLKPSKKRLVDLVASKSALDMALAFANELFLAFEARGHRVMFDPTHERFHRAEVDQRENPKHGERMSDLWCPTRCTVVYVGTAAFGLTLIEMTEHVPAEYRKSGYVRANERARPSRSRNVYHDTWSTMRDLPSGRLCLQVYSPYPRVKWLKHWRETPARPLSAQISRIIRELEAATADVARLFDEGERQAEIAGVAKRRRAALRRPLKTVGTNSRRSSIHGPRPNGSRASSRRLSSVWWTCPGTNETRSWNVFSTLENCSAP